MITIKQLAGKIGVSKTSISKKIDNLGLRNSLQMVGGTWLIPDDIENTIINAYNRKPKSQTVGTNQSQTIDTVVDTLVEQLKVKDKQIEELQKLLDQEQKLRMVTEQKLLAIEDATHKNKWWPWHKKDKPNI